MKKISFILAGFILSWTAGAWAQTTFTVSANIPAGTGVGFTVSQVNATTNAFTTMPAGTTALNFGTLQLTNVGTAGSPNYIFLPTIYWALDIAVTGGAGSPNTTVTYTDGAKPTGAVSSLGVKGTVMFTKEVYTSSTTPPTETGIGTKKRFLDLVSFNVPASSVSGGWLRAYIGIWNGNTTQTFPDPSNGQPFTTGDAAGTYTGTLTFTETVG